jgi:dihydropyrimidine dehydrogenase (NADP+)
MLSNSARRVLRFPGAIRGLAQLSPQGYSFDHDSISERIALNPTTETMQNVRVRSTTEVVGARKQWKRNVAQESGLKFRDFTDVKHTTLSEQAAIEEADRCFKCVDAPCQHSCPTQVSS